MNAQVERFVQAMVAKFGRDVTVQVIGVGAWRVPREYVLRYGIRSIDVPELAQRMGWEQVGWVVQGP